MSYAGTKTFQNNQADNEAATVFFWLQLSTQTTLSWGSELRPINFLCVL